MQRAVIFIRKNVFLGIDVGHVGWSFQWDESSVICGSTENPLGTPHTSWYEKGAWHKRLPFNEVLPEFRTEKVMYGKNVPSYDRYKVIDVHAPDPRAALNTMTYCESLDYYVSGYPKGRNCIDDAYDILRAFGYDTPPTPQEHWTPNDWFAQLPGTDHSLWTEKAASQHIAQHFEFPIGEIIRPTWRTPETEEYEVFQQQIKGVASM